MAFKLPSSMYQNAGIAGAANSLASAMFDKNDKTGLDPSQIYAHESLARQRKAAAALDEQKFGMWGDVQRAGNLSPIQIATGRQSTSNQFEKGMNLSTGRNMLLENTRWGGDPVSAGAADGTAISNAMVGQGQPITSEMDLQRAYALLGETMPGTAFSPNRRSDIFEAMEQGDLDQQASVNAANIEKQKLIESGEITQQELVNAANLKKQELIEAGKLTQQELIEAGELTQTDKTGASALAQQGSVNLAKEYIDANILSPQASAQLVPGYETMSDEDLLAKGFQRFGQGLRPTGKGSNKTYIYSHSDDIKARNTLTRTLTDLQTSENPGIDKVPPGVWNEILPSIKTMVEDNTHKHFGKTADAVKEKLGQLMSGGMMEFPDNNDNFWTGGTVHMPKTMYTQIQALYDEMQRRGAEAEAQAIRIIQNSLKQRGYTDSDIRSIENWVKGER